MNSDIVQSDQGVAVGHAGAGDAAQRGASSNDFRGVEKGQAMGVIC